MSSFYFRFGILKIRIFFYKNTMTKEEKKSQDEVSRIESIIGKKTLKGTLETLKKYHPEKKIFVVDEEMIGGKNLVWKCR